MKPKSHIKSKNCWSLVVINKVAQFLFMEEPMALPNMNNVHEMLWPVYIYIFYIYVDED